MWSCLLVCLLADNASAKDAALAPRWAEGQETLYQGVVKEVSRAQAIQLQRQYQLEVRILVLAVAASVVNSLLLPLIRPTSSPESRFQTPMVSSRLAETPRTAPLIFVTATACIERVCPCISRISPTR